MLQFQAARTEERVGCIVSKDVSCGLVCCLSLALSRVDTYKRPWSRSLEFYNDRVTGSHATRLPRSATAPGSLDRLMPSRRASIGCTHARHRQPAGRGHGNTTTQRQRVQWLQLQTATASRLLAVTSHRSHLIPCIPAELSLSLSLAVARPYLPDCCCLEKAPGARVPQTATTTRSLSHITPTHVASRTHASLFLSLISPNISPRARGTRRRSYWFGCVPP